MSPLVTFLVIMLLTVVYNESQFVADYQDNYQKVLAKIPVPLNLCDLASKKNLCKNSNFLRQFLKKTDYLRDDDEDFSREYAHDYIEDEDIKTFSVKTDQKRNNANQIVSLSDASKCATVMTHLDLGENYYPRLIFNLTCEHSNNKSKVCSEGSSCQPVKHSVIVLSRHEHIPFDVPQRLRACWLSFDVPHGLKGCWLLKEMPIHIGCKCGRSKKDYEN